MRRCCFSLPSSLATDSASSAMCPRPKYRGGRYPSQRSFSDSSHNGGRGQFASGDSNVHPGQERNRVFQQGARVNFVTGDSHFRTVQDANRGLRPGEIGDSTIQAGYRPPTFNSRRHFIQSQTYGLSSGNSHDTQFHHPQHYYRGQSMQQSPQYSQNRQFQQHRPSKQNRPFWRPPQSDWSLAAQTSEEQKSRPQRPPDYRIWENAKTGPPSDCERFVVLSYNILADYLAINHRSKLYYHIPRHMLDWQWRKRSILFELGLWSADIMCFQEVDKFYDLEEELKSRGYCGTWKMRTGNPVDGCAIFWHASRFKLLQEECIEFSKLGLRDNVAQICVLELVSENETGNTAHQSAASSAGSRKIVVCNIHVLYNPKRGEIKLGQIRALLDRAYAVSQAWADAPVVLCGDFNCTPKSPLYNFISEQKLSLSGLDRDKVSGQASAEIRPKIPDSQNTRGQPQSPMDDNKLKDSTLDEQKQRNQDNKKENSFNVNDPHQLRCVDNNPAPSAESCPDRQSASEGSELNYELRKDSEQNPADDAANENGLPSDTSLDKEPNSNILVGGTVFPPDDVKSGKDKCTYQMASSHVTELSDLDNLQAKDCTNVVSTASCTGEDYTSRVTVDLESLDSSDSKITSFVLSCESTSDDVETTSEVAGHVMSQSVNDKQDNPSTLHGELLVDTMGDSIDEELRKLSLNEPEESSTEVGCPYEDDDTFLSALHNLGGADSTPGSQSAKEFSSGLDFEPVEGEISTYDPSLWTPMDIATATGSADCLFLEHPLKLKSTYAEVVDSSGTRDSNGEPMVTSYNRCFMGTVDYIWHSEGLQTTRVLAPIPKRAMQWTTGFPTKKWGSDHIALVSELALVKGSADQRNEVIEQPLAPESSNNI